MKHRLIQFTLVFIFMLSCSAVSKAQVQKTPVLEEAPPIMTSAKQLPLEGIYDVAVAAKGEEGALPLTLTIKRVGEKLTAESKGSEYITITGIKVDGANVTLSAAFQGFPFDMLGTLKEEGMSGTWKGGASEGTWKALRHPEK